MKKIVKVLIMCLISMSFVCVVSFAAERELTDKENAAFITREEFNIWQKSFIASLSELDKISTEKIYDDMDFYDMQYRFTPKYKQEEWWDPDADDGRGKPKPKLEEAIIKGKAQRGRL